MDERNQGMISDDSSAALLLDEAVWMLFERLESEPTGSLDIRADHGYYQASFNEFEGEWKPVLSDALNSLLGVLRGI